MKFAKSSEELAQLYGDFYSSSPRVTFEIFNVPENLRPLIPYAAFWGLTDDLERERLVNCAPPVIAQNLREIVTLFEDSLDEWLAGTEAKSDSPTDAYVAFSSLRMAADFA